MLINVTIKCVFYKFTITIKNKIHDKFMNLKSPLNPHAYVNTIDLKYIRLLESFRAMLLLKLKYLQYNDLILCILHVF